MIAESVLILTIMCWNNLYFINGKIMLLFWMSKFWMILWIKSNYKTRLLGHLNITNPFASLRQHWRSCVLNLGVYRFVSSAATGRYYLYSIANLQNDALWEGERRKCWLPPQCIKFAPFSFPTQCIILGNSDGLCCWIQDTVKILLFCVVFDFKNFARRPNSWK